LLGARDEGLLTNLGLPVVFTMHDERLFTGGCHHAGDCTGYTSNCRDCPQAKRLARPFVFSGHAESSRQLRIGRIAAVGPSQWIVDEARASSALAGVPIFHIPNTIDTKVFTSERRQRARLRLDIPPGATVLAWQPGKGDALLAEVAQRVRNAAPDRQLLVLQTPGLEQHVIPTRTVSWLSNESDRADFWAAADIAFSLTEFDNFPNITLEAMTCAVPFVAPNVGGAAEAVSQTGGGLAVARDPEAIATALVRLCAGNWERERGQALPRVTGQRL